jgi:DNA-binding MarR family transcriptional regulator
MTRARDEALGERLEAERASGLGDVLDFMRVMWAVDHALQKGSKRMEVKLGVTGPQRLVLRVVGRFPRLSAGRLAELMHLHPSTLTGVLKRLERQGLLRRCADPVDARRSLLVLTPKGSRFNEQKHGPIEAAVRRALRSAPRARRDAARAMLGTIARALEEPGAEPRARKLVR